MPGNHHLSLAIFFLSLFFVSTRADDNTNSDPIAGYIPSNTPTAIALTLYILSATIHWIHWFRYGRQRYMLTLTLGMTAMALGFAVRIGVHALPDSLGVYMVMDLFILLSPCAFLATDYVLLARLASTFDDEVVEKTMFIRPSRIVRIFVWSDVATFLLQGGGGGLTASNNPDTANIGTKIVLTGLSLQLASFGLFAITLVIFGLRIRSQFPEVWQSDSTDKSLVGGADWRVLFYTMCLTCIGILIRSAFRIAEFAGGYRGTVATHEAYFYSLDSLPLWIVMSFYCVIWPPRFLHSHARGKAAIPMTEV
ncbi:RTA1 like protein-domain-containing protein [Roridomyces roridus]|uniref:RTA1 like protein-domain-containing protein n=1 Tax=Roridomyces roridus TaxID=1738132 RepID=A0AAD7AYL6_9AGAR|nr:RTA1 like protein-domain-containing protein [Roridomyces roridus]KAJ7636180.1 RTA1 like protein-domain-containing protein [Roridomyces roridus]